MIRRCSHRSGWRCTETVSSAAVGRESEYVSFACVAGICLCRVPGPPPIQLPACVAERTVRRMYTLLVTATQLSMHLEFTFRLWGHVRHPAHILVVITCILGSDSVPIADVPVPYRFVADRVESLGQTYILLFVHVHFPPMVTPPHSASASA